MQVPNIESVMTEAEAKKNLQRAINLLCEIYEALGNIPVGVVHANASVEVAANYSRYAHKTVAELANSDEIPF